MKNLLNKLSIEKLEVVPIEHLSDRPTQAKKANWFGYKHHKGWEKTKHDSPWKIASRIIENNIGKSFDMAFSYYCKLVPQRYQKEFLEEFLNTRGWDSPSSYIVDKGGNIQHNPIQRWRGRYRRTAKDYQGPYVFNSPDFKTELRHKITGHKKFDFLAIHEKRNVRINDHYLKYRNYYPYNTDGKLLYYEYGAHYSKLKPLYQRYRAQESNFEAVTIQGWQMRFASKNDPRYIKLWAEKKVKIKKAEKQREIERKQKAYNFMTKNELELKELRKTDNYKVLLHGFDLETSFRN